MAKWTKATLLDRLGDELMDQDLIGNKADILELDGSTIESLETVTLRDFIDGLKASIVKESMVRRTR